MSNIITWKYQVKPDLTRNNDYDPFAGLEYINLYNLNRVPGLETIRFKMDQSALEATKSSFLTFSWHSNDACH